MLILFLKPGCRFYQGIYLFLRKNIELKKALKACVNEQQAMVNKRRD
jgi:hypothetical protein